MTGCDLKLTKEQAVDLYTSGKWETMSHMEIVKTQLYTERLFVPFDVFHEAVETVLERPVYTHEFANAKELQKEFEKKQLTS